MFNIERHTTHLKVFLSFDGIHCTYTDTVLQRERERFDKESEKGLREKMDSLLWTAKTKFRQINWPQFSFDFNGISSSF